MSRTRVELDHDGMAELLKSKEVADECKRHADRVKKACGEGYTSDVYIGRTRANASVGTATVHAHYSNLKHNTLLRAISEVKQRWKKR